MGRRVDDLIKGIPYFTIPDQNTSKEFKKTSWRESKEISTFRDELIEVQVHICTYCTTVS